MDQGGRSAAGGEPAYAVSEFRAAPSEAPSAPPVPPVPPVPPEPPDAPQTTGQRANGWTRASGWRELALGLAIFALYLVVTHHVRVTHVVADSHARFVMRLESALHIDAERPLNSWLAHHDVLGALAAWEYATTYIVTTFGFLGWLWWRRRESYGWARGVLVGATLMAICCFAFWPLTPPRLLGTSGFSDVVAAHHPFLSWGSNTVSAGADQWAAMPSLHIGWAVWVTVVSLRVGAGRVGKSLAAVHLLVTSYVVIATGNHFVVDIGAGFAVVALAMLMYPVWTTAIAWATRKRPVKPLAIRVPAADAFFLHVESADVPQVVGGVAVVSTSDVDGQAIGTDRLRELLTARLPDIPQFRRRLQQATRWRHARWVESDRIDLRYHVRSTRIVGGTGRRGLHQLVAALASRPLDLRHPPWRLWFVRDVGPDEAAVVVLVHHAVGDGLGVVDLLRHLLDSTAVPEAPEPPGVSRRVRAVAAVATALGVAQLALDGRAQQLAFTGRLSGERVWRTLSVPLHRVRAIAKATGTRVTDVLLSAVGEVVGDLLARRGIDRAGRRLRIAVPLTLRRPDDAGGLPGAGNLTAALRIDVPLDEMPPVKRLAAVHACAQQRRRAARVLATTAVVRAIGLLPPPLHRRAARAMYRSRFFGAILTNMPGPSCPMSFAGLPLKDVYPVIPLAEGVPIAAGTLGWNGQLCLSVTAEPRLLPEAQDIDVRLEAALHRLTADVEVLAAGGGPERELQAWPPSSC